MSPQQLIKSTLGPYLVRGKTYPSPLPTPLQLWYCYSQDGGHSIVVALAQYYAIGADPEGFLVPAPVKTVLSHEWHEQEGYILVRGLEYSEELGLVTPPEDEEF